MLRSRLQPRARARRRRKRAEMTSLLGVQVLTLPEVAATGERVTSDVVASATDIYNSRAGRAQGGGPWTAHFEVLSKIRRGIVSCFGRAIPLSRGRQASAGSIPAVPRNESRRPALTGSGSHGRSIVGRPVSRIREMRSPCGEQKNGLGRTDCVSRHES
jgi:hypothetical protein